MAFSAQIEKSGHLAQAYADLFFLGAHIKDARELGSVEQFRAKLHQAFQSADERAKQQGVPQDSIIQAKYAMAAFIDEMISNSRWSGKEQWASAPLQYDFFGEFVAGEGFFKRLEAIRSALPVNIDLLQIYALCLIFGFEGQYRLHERERLKGIIDDVTREIQSKQGGGKSLSGHAKRPDELLERVKHDLPAWSVLSIAAGIIALFYLALSYLSSQDAGHVMEQLRKLMQEAGT